MLCLLAALLPAGALAQSAVVNSGSGSRLNMRKEPSAQSKSLGQFYSGTQVEIVSDAGDGWSEVSLGGSLNSLSGYMASEYLATGSDADGAADDTYDMEVSSPYGTQSVVLRSKPSDSYDAVAMLAVGESVQVIGVSGDFYYVQLDDCIGCLANDELK